MPNLAGSRSLVTGASGGLGSAMARHLARWGSNLVLSARRTEPMEQLAEELRSGEGVEVEVVPGDLLAEGGPGALFEAVTAGGRELDILINNAGYGLYGRFHEIDRENQLRMIQLDVGALTDLAHRFVEHAIPTGRPAYLLNVASIAGVVPVPKMAAYCGCKAYVVSLTEAMAVELARTPVKVCVLCPGPVDTEFWAIAGKQVGLLSAMMKVSPEKTTEEALRALFRGWPTKVLPGAVNKLFATGGQMIPRKLAGIGSFVFLGGLSDQD